MHIKFLKHGQGKTSRAVDYLLAEKDHAGKMRATPARVLRGHPELTRRLGDALTFQHKYRSAVFAFHPDDHPTDEQIDEFLNKAEALCFAGLDPDQFDYLAVYHNDPTPHIHAIYPRVELTSGKSLNVAPPGWQTDFDALRDFFNAKYHWKSPDIEQYPDQARITQPQNDRIEKSVFTQNRAETKQLIEDFLMTQIESGAVENREEIILTLQALGFEIPRQGKDYITILDPETNLRIRLKGAIYDQSWHIESTLTSASTCAKPGDATSDSSRIERLERELEERISKRAAYHRKRYPKPSPGIEHTTFRNVKRKPKKRSVFEESAENAMAQNGTHRDESLFGALQQHLGADAIFVDPDSISTPSNRDESSQARVDGGERHHSGAVWGKAEDLCESGRNRGDFRRWLPNFKNKIGDPYDRIRTAINGGIRKIIDAISAGHEHAESASEALEQASHYVDESIQRNRDAIQRGVQQAMVNRKEDVNCQEIPRL
jgi:hypothetical protein